jgi:hypothetical protein
LPLDSATGKPPDAAAALNETEQETLPAPESVDAEQVTAERAAAVCVMVRTAPAPVVARELPAPFDAAPPVIWMAVEAEWVVDERVTAICATTPLGITVELMP